MSSEIAPAIHQSTPPPYSAARRLLQLPPPPMGSRYTPTQIEGQHVAIPMILPVVVVFFFLTTLYTIYLLRDLLRYFTGRWVLHGNPTAPPAQPPGSGPRGLDASILASFPVFTYDSVRGLRKGKSELECAVCLSEFSNGDNIRLLTVCNHAFHPECIDLWLSSHTTCPVCRSNLDKPPQEVFALSVAEGGEDGLVISVAEEERLSGDQGSCSPENRRQTEQFPKSHSTGHSLVIERRTRTAEEEGGDDHDRYTLRLQGNPAEDHPLHVRFGSCIAFRDGSSGTAAARGGAAGSSGG